MAINTAHTLGIKLAGMITQLISGFAVDIQSGQNKSENVWDIIMYCCKTIWLHIEGDLPLIPDEDCYSKS